MKKLIAYAIHFIAFLIAAVVVWNYAYELAELTNTPNLLFDIAAFVFGFVSFTFSVLTTDTYLESKRAAKQKQNEII